MYMCIAPPCNFVYKYMGFWTIFEYVESLTKESKLSQKLASLNTWINPLCNSINYHTNLSSNPNTNQYTNFLSDPNNNHYTRLNLTPTLIIGVTVTLSLTIPLTISITLYEYKKVCSTQII